jgi:hypothetical protein
MRGFGGGKGPGRALVGGSLVAGLLGSATVLAGGSAGGHAAGTPHARAALEDQIPELRVARLGARERLGRPECQAVLADFVAVTGQRLDEVLRASGRTAQEQLDLLVLQSGLGRPACGRGATMAFTQIHSRAVSICLRPFTLLPREEQEAVLIHEMLHSLGLGEGPPESVAITARVLARCAP